MAPDSLEIFSVQQRLALSRRVLLNHLQGDNRRHFPESGLDSEQQSGSMSNFLSRSSYGLLVRNLVKYWWNRHPVNAAGQLARPFLERYAQQSPVKLFVISAGIGALVILIKPWRLLSATALLSALLKTSSIADIVTTLMEKKYDR